MIRYHVRHRTRFNYEKQVSFARCNLRLKPIAWPGQRLLDHTLEITPGGELSPASRTSALVNTTSLVITEPARTIEIVSRFDMEVTREPEWSRPDDADIAAVAKLARQSNDMSDSGPANFLYPSDFIPQNADIAAWAAETLGEHPTAYLGALALTERIQREFVFDPSVTATFSLPAQAFHARAGVCQDFAQIMICGLRAAGLPAAYVSGYIRTLPPPGQPRLQGADASHGWVLVWLGERGWVGMDPTNGILMAQDHIVMAIGRDYLDIAPIDGIFTGYGTQDMTVEVDVEPVEIRISA